MGWASGKMNRLILADMSKEITPVEERIAQPSPPRLRTTAHVGDMIGQYRVDAVIGDGGMGTVYRCTDLTMKRTVAVKVLHPHLVETSKWYLRFAMEAEAIGRLEHPGIIKIHQFSPTDPPYIVMDFVQGKSLADVLASSGSLPYKRVLKIAVQIAYALAHAHAKGVVHRDLKPSNVIILQGTDDAVQILDFGIAKLEGQQDADAIKLTQTGEVFGSPAYMSPEQVHGINVGPLSDQYSLACLIYECLTGSPPFVGDSPVDVMMQHVGTQPQSLREASLGQAFPPELERIVQTMLKKEPSERFASMAEAADALRHLDNPKLRKASDRAAANTKTEAKKAGLKLADVLPWVLVWTVVLALLAVFIYVMFSKEAPKPLTSEPASSSSYDLNSTSKEASSDILIADAKLEKELKRVANGQFDFDKQFQPPTDVDDNSFRFFLQYGSGLRKLYIGKSLNLTDDCMHYIENLPLVKLTANYGVGHKGIVSISKIKTLHFLEIQSANVSNPDLIMLDTLVDLKAFNFGHATSGTFTGAGLAHFFRTHKKLETLYMNEVSVNGIVSEMAKLPLKEIEINNTPFTQDEILQLSQIKTLKQLRADQMELDEHSLKALASIPGLKELIVRKVTGANSSDELLRLRKERPELQITSVTWRAND
jgi:serine/threonine-protein kinase